MTDTKTTDPAQTEARLVRLRALRRDLHLLTDKLRRLRELAAEEGARPLARALEHAATAAFDGQASLSRCIRVDGGYPRSFTVDEDPPPVVDRNASPSAWAKKADVWLLDTIVLIETTLDDDLGWLPSTRLILREVETALDKARDALRDAVERPRRPA